MRGRHARKPKGAGDRSLAPSRTAPTGTRHPTRRQPGATPRRAAHPAEELAALVCEHVHTHAVQVSDGDKADEAIVPPRQHVQLVRLRTAVSLRARRALVVRSALAP